MSANFGRTRMQGSMEQNNIERATKQGRLISAYELISSLYDMKKRMGYMDPATLISTIQGQYWLAAKRQCVQWVTSLHNNGQLLLPIQVLKEEFPLLQDSMHESRFLSEANLSQRDSGRMESLKVSPGVESWMGGPSISSRVAPRVAARRDGPREGSVSFPRRQDMTVASPGNFEKDGFTKFAERDRALTSSKYRVREGVGASDLQMMIVNQAREAFARKGRTASVSDPYVKSDKDIQSVAKLGMSKSSKISSATQSRKTSFSKGDFGEILLAGLNSLAKEVGNTKQIEQLRDAVSASISEAPSSSSHQRSKDDFHRNDDVDRGHEMSQEHFPRNDAIDRGHNMHPERFLKHDTVDRQLSMEYFPKNDASDRNHQRPKDSSPKSYFIDRGHHTSPEPFPWHDDKDRGKHRPMDHFLRHDDIERDQQWPTEQFPGHDGVDRGCKRSSNGFPKSYAIDRGHHQPKERFPWQDSVDRGQVSQERFPGQDSVDRGQVSQECFPWQDSVDRGQVSQERFPGQDSVDRGQVSQERFPWQDSVDRGQVSQERFPGHDMVDRGQVSQECFPWQDNVDRGQVSQERFPELDGVDKGQQRSKYGFPRKEAIDRVKVSQERFPWQDSVDRDQVSQKHFPGQDRMDSERQVSEERFPELDRMDRGHQVSEERFPGQDRMDRDHQVSEERLPWQDRMDRNHQVFEERFPWQDSVDRGCRVSREAFPWHDDVDRDRQVSQECFSGEEDIGRGYNRSSKDGFHRDETIDRGHRIPPERHSGHDGVNRGHHRSKDGYPRDEATDRGRHMPPEPLPGHYDKDRGHHMHPEHLLGRDGINRGRKVPRERFPGHDGVDRGHLRSKSGFPKDETIDRGHHMPPERFPQRYDIDRGHQKSKDGFPRYEAIESGTRMSLEHFSGPITKDRGHSMSQEHEPVYNARNRALHKAEKCNVRDGINLEPHEHFPQNTASRTQEQMCGSMLNKATPSSMGLACAKKGKPSVCPYPGCTVLSRKMRRHVNNHLPLAFHVLELEGTCPQKPLVNVRLKGLRILAKGLCKDDNIKNLVEIIEDCSTPSETSCISPALNKAMLKLCYCAGWKVPEQFMVYPINSPAVLLHWKPLAMLVGMASEPIKSKLFHFCGKRAVEKLKIKSKPLPAEGKSEANKEPKSGASIAGPSGKSKVKPAIKRPVNKSLIKDNTYQILETYGQFGSALPVKKFGSALPAKRKEKKQLGAKKPQTVKEKNSTQVTVEVMCDMDK